MATSRPRHVLITGGSRGIGLSIAQLFAKNSYRCTLISRNEDSLQAAVATLAPLPQVPTSSTSESTSAESEALDSKFYRHTYIAGNISHGSHFWAKDAKMPLGSVLQHPTVSEASRIDVLINCAGISQSRLFMGTGEAETSNIVSLNLTAMMIGTRYLMRQGYLRGPKPGDKITPSIVNVSSLLGLSGGYGAVAYAASKAGVLGFTRALATEYSSHKVRVNAIVPGYISTDMTKDLDEEQLKKRIPLGRFGKPEEIAKAALFLAENEYAHNCVLGLDGGLSAV